MFSVAESFVRGRSFVRFNIPRVVLTVLYRRRTAPRVLGILFNIITKNRRCFVVVFLDLEGGSQKATLVVLLVVGIIFPWSRNP